LPYWTGIIVFHAIYAGFELKRFQNFNKYGEVGNPLSLFALEKPNYLTAFGQVVKATRA
jgi:hypothetical protein